MAQYSGMILTNKGIQLQAKAEAGISLTFTKVKIGDGQASQGQSLVDLADLIHPLKTLEILSVRAESGGLCRISSNITNQGVVEGFYVREVGLFANDPDEGEILYAITTATIADYLPPEGGSTAINNQFDLIVIVGNASQVTATISPDGLITQTEFNLHVNDTSIHLTQADKDNWNGKETPEGAQEKADAAAAASIPKIEKGQPNGVASLDDEGNVPIEQIPPIDFIPAPMSEPVLNTLNEGQIWRLGFAPSPKYRMKVGADKYVLALENLMTKVPTNFTPYIGFVYNNGTFNRTYTQIIGANPASGVQRYITIGANTVQCYVYVPANASSGAADARLKFDNLDFTSVKNIEVTWRVYAGTNAGTYFAIGSDASSPTFSTFGGAPSGGSYVTTTLDCSNIFGWGYLTIGASEGGTAGWIRETGLEISSIKFNPY